MSKVHKHCSILNYIRHQDKDLYELIQDLCIGRIFAPRRDEPGLTFLRPDAELLKKLQSLAAGDEPEKVVQAFHGMVLKDNYESPADFDANKDNIVTYNRKKLPVKSVDGQKVVLSNGATLELDKDFERRNDRSNISVYILKGDLVPHDTAPAADKAPKKKVKGGAEISAQRQVLFAKVLEQWCESIDKGVRDPALEVLVSLLNHAEETKCPNYLSMCSQLTPDTITSLAIVLQPMSQSPSYVPDELFAGFAKEYSTDATPLYSYVESPVDVYREHMNKAKGDVGVIDAARDKLMDNVSKFTIVKNLAKGYNEVANELEKLGKYAARVAVLRNPKKAAAESELRVFAALLHDNSAGSRVYDEYADVFMNRCKLEQPHVADNQSLISASSVAYYFSTVNMIARSDAFVSWPGHQGAALSGLADETAVIDLCANIKLNDGLNSKYNDEINKVKAQLMKFQKKSTEQSA